MNIITVANPRKGVGKTTTVLNIAESLRRRGKKVLVIDMDPRGNATTNLSWGKEPPDFSRNVLTAMVEKDPMLAVIESRRKGTMFIPSSDELVWLEYEIKHRAHMREDDLLRDALDQIRDASEDNFDYVLIDTPPSGSPFLYNNAFMTADYIIIPIDSKSRWALSGLTKMTDVIANIMKANTRLDILGVLLTHYDMRMNMCKIIEENAQKTFKDKLFNTIIHTNSVFKKAESRNMTALEYNRNSNGVKEYFMLTTEIQQKFNDANIKDLE